MYSGVIVIDGNRIRFRVDDWKTMLAIKALRTNIRLIMSQSFRNPGRQLSQQQQAWYDIWQEIFRQAYKDKR
jgi:ATP-dependent RNA helicase DHX29